MDMDGWDVSCGRGMAQESALPRDRFAFRGGLPAAQVEAVELEVKRGERKNCDSSKMNERY